MIRALTVPLEQDLQALSRYLWSRGVAHRISEQAHQQILWVANQQDVALVLSAYQTALRGELPQTPSGLYQSGGAGIRQAVAKLQQVPVTSVMILLSMLATALLYTGVANDVFDLLRMGTWNFMLESGQLWRMITPVFLHFGLMHLAFNMVMLWYFGRQLECHEPYRVLIPLLLLFSITPNLAQYWAEGIRFGGMSGVVYALLGYCWLYNRLSGRLVYIFPGAIMGLMVAWLVIGFTGLLTIFGFPPMANVAHLGGLVIGLAGAFAVSQFRMRV